MDPKDPMGYEEFGQIRAQAEREIARLEAMTSEPEKVVIRLEECIDLINKPADLWEMAEPLERQQLTDRVFEYLTYNLDQQCITDFRLKPAMDTFMAVRYAVDKSERAKGSDDESDPSRPGTMVCPQGLVPLFEGMLSRETLEAIVGHLHRLDYLKAGRPGEWRAGTQLNSLIDEQAKSTVSLSIYSNVAGEQAKIEVRDRHTRRTVARVTPHWLQRPILTLEGRALSVEWHDNEAVWVAFDPRLDVAEKLPYRSARQWLSYEVACLLPTQLGLARGVAPLVETVNGWLCFHWLGDLYGTMLLELLGQQFPVGQTAQPGLCLRLPDRLPAWPPWAEAQVAVYLKDNHRKYEPMLALGPFHHLLPVAIRQRAVIEQVGVSGFLEAVASLRLVEAPEEMTEDLIQLLTV